MCPKGSVYKQKLSRYGAVVKLVSCNQKGAPVIINPKARCLSLLLRARVNLVSCRCYSTKSRRHDHRNQKSSWTRALTQGGYRKNSCKDNCGVLKYPHHLKYRTMVFLRQLIHGLSLFFDESFYTVLMNIAVLGLIIRLLSTYYRIKN
jgi:hypothetical protein